MKRTTWVGAVLLACVWAGAPVAGAKEVTLKAATAFAVGSSSVSEPFERFVKRVNEQGKGVIQIDLVGGPDAIPPFQQGNAVQSGVLDMAAVPGVFYTTVVPEAGALKMTLGTSQQMREDGTLDLINEVWAEKGLYLLGRTWETIPFNIYLKKPLRDGSLKGMRLRSTPNYRSFFAALGAVNVDMAPGEVYTALERGVVDGFGWQSTGLFDLGWDTYTRYRVEPSFYAADLGILVNQKKWQSLSEEQRQFLIEQAKWYEGLNSEQGALLTEERERQAAVGIEVIELQGEQRAAFEKASRDASWEALTEQAPKHMKRLREKFEAAR